MSTLDLGFSYAGDAAVGSEYPPAMAPRHPAGSLPTSASFLNRNRPLPPNPLCRLRGFNAPSAYVMDMMHTGPGILKGLWKLLQGVGSYGVSVAHYEATRNGRDFSGLIEASEYILLVAMH